MTSALTWLACFAGGVLFGLLFYGGLWITVRVLLATRHPAAVTMGSLDASAWR